MKKFFVAIFVFLSFMPLFANVKNVENKLDILTKNMVSDYMTKHKIVLKKNLAIIDIENKSEDAKKHHLGDTIRDLLSAQFSKAPIFTLVERKNLKKILKEQSLQLSGVTTGDKAAEIGEVLNAELLLYGSITELGDSFNISITLVDVETGEQLNKIVSLAKSDLIETARDLLDRKFVQKEGIGISILASSSGMTGDAASFYIPVFYNLTTVQHYDTFFNRGDGVELRYRFTKNVMIGFGVTQVWGQVKYIQSQTINLSSIIPGFTDGVTDGMRLEVEGYTTPLTLYFNINPMTRLSLYAGAGIEWMTLRSSGIFDNYGGMGFGKNQIFPEGVIDGMLYNIKIGAEYFLTPRFSLSLSLGYQIGSIKYKTGPYKVFYPNLPKNVNISGLVVSLEVPLYF